MRGSDLGPSGPPPGERRTNRGDSRLKRIVLLVGVLGAFVMLAVGAIFAGAASAATEMNLACALKSNGLMRYVEKQNQCKKSENQVTIKPGSVLTCVQPDGSVRMLSNSANCKPPAVQLTLPPADGTVYFCAANSTGVLRYVTDPSQCTSTEFLVFVTDAPVANNDAYSVHEGDTLNVAAPGVLGNDTDAENDRLNAVLMSGPAHASSFALNANGSFTYVHDGSETTSDSFTYKANDGTADSNVATVNITINPVNDAPVANDAPATTNEDHTVTITLSGTDADDDDLTFAITDQPDNGVLHPIVTTGRTTATVNYTPKADFNGTDSFTYKANDGNGGTDTADVRITVIAANDAPSFAAGDNVTVNEDSGAYSAAWATAISAGPGDEAGQTVSFVITSNSNPSLFSTQPSVAPNGTLSYTPADNANGTATVTVIAQDDGGILNGGNDTSAPQTFTITVNAVNDEPSFTAGGDVSVNENSGAYDATWATAISAGPNESGQTVSFVVSNGNNALFSIQPAISSSGTLTFTPEADAFGSATVTVYLMDSGGIANGGDDTTATQTFTISVNAVNP